MILLTGATGYVGGRLLQRLQEDGHKVRCLARRPEVRRVFEVTGEGSSAIIRQTATFDPAGKVGIAYWYALYPLHQLVFKGMLQGVARAALDEQRRN